ncbi:MAG TPA: prepilin-type N-terminal cleavage/methylation domain-containing protein [Phycisphaerales bacterium]|nr:prepilin-type N-terminal cleavage/methylation domain-containing protein [Phycisphaerales bacterium]
MKSSRRAFTLIELLVVIAIIAMLISILLPSLKQARETARAVLSMANLKQQGTALFGYQETNKGYWPGDHYEGPKGSWISWVPRIREFLGGGDKAAEVFYCPSTPRDFKWVYRAGTTDMPPGCLDLGYTDLREDGFLYPPFASVKRYFGYGYNGGGANWQIGGSANEQPLGLGQHVKTRAGAVPPRWLWEAKNSDIIFPNRMVAIGDSTADGTWDSSLYPEDPPTTLTGLPLNFLGARHAGKANVLQADFSVRVRNPRDLMITEPGITTDQKRARIEEWNKQGKAFNVSAGY